MRRRRFLKTSGTAIAIGASTMGLGSADDADPRPTTGGELPNPNVPHTHTGALGGPPFNETSEIPAGDWILHDNGWVFVDNPDKEYAKWFANNTVQTYTIQGEEFVLDEFDDWNYYETDGVPKILFEYTTPPKELGTEYVVRWDVEALDEELEDAAGFFPSQNEVRIVER